jgi:hypothetical protein
VVSVTPRPRFTPRNGPLVPIRPKTGRASKLVWSEVRGKNFASDGDRNPVNQSVVRHNTKKEIYLNSVLIRKYVGGNARDGNCVL